ncbi:hypothetical protein Leryth_019896 [Lithospermum erythrorhizon]|nr:hypothetical protein Leryth_019896 [Lithospermum erythrorhizon]
MEMYMERDTSSMGGPLLGLYTPSGFMQVPCQVSGLTFRSSDVSPWIWSEQVPVGDYHLSGIAPPPRLITGCESQEFHLVCLCIGSPASQLYILDPTEEKPTWRILNVPGRPPRFAWGHSTCIVGGTRAVVLELASSSDLCPAKILVITCQSAWLDALALLKLLVLGLYRLETLYVLYYVLPSAFVKEEHHKYKLEMKEEVQENGSN